MIEYYHRVGSAFIALNAQFEVVGIIKMFEDDYKYKYEKQLKTNPRAPTKGGD
jgi:hypothetical protein